MTCIHTYAPNLEVNQISHTQEVYDNATHWWCTLRGHSGQHILIEQSLFNNQLNVVHILIFIVLKDWNTTHLLRPSDLEDDSDF